MKKILVINGPNLNLLGTREPDIYGSISLEDIHTLCGSHGKSLGLSCECTQSNSEGELVDAIQDANQNYHGIIINAAAYTHTSVAIRDALLAVDVPIIEVHLSNIFKREAFRQHSYISDIAFGVICGFGIQGYQFAIDAMANAFDA